MSGPRWLTESPSVFHGIPTRELPGTPPSPNAEGSSDGARLRVLSGPGAGSSCVVIQEAIVGRAPDCHLILNEAEISRHHFRVFPVAPREYSIADAGSRNGTLLNGTAVTRTPARLAFGDRIQIGKSVLLFAHFDPAEERLLQTQKLQSLGQLAGGIAHDVNNLLGAVLVNVQYLKTKVDTAPDVEQCVNDCEESLQRVLEMVGRLLGFARRGRLESRPVPLAPLAGEACRAARHRALGELNVLIDVPGGLCALGDPTQLYQVLANLCANAVDAMPGGGTLRLEASGVDVRGEAASPLPPGRYARLVVADTGKGMSAEVLSHLFEPFFTTKPIGKGTGLGLATVHGIVENHGGRISVSSTPGKGTEFVICLPWAPPVAAATINSAAAPKDEWAGETSGRDSGMRPVKERVVLIVDDEPVVQRSAKRLLSMIGSFEVITASNGDEAVELYNAIKDHAVLVLVDVCMPGRTGTDTCRELIRLDPRAPVVLCSGSDSESQRRDLYESGVPFLRKPFELHALRAAIAEAAARR